MFRKVRKLVVAVVGLAVMFAQERLGVPLGEFEGALVELIIASGVAFGVWRAPNDQV